MTESRENTHPTTTAERDGDPELPAPRSGDGTALSRNDQRYGELAYWGYNLRFTGAPDSVHVVRSTVDVVRAIADAVRDGRRLAVRSGGHCFEDFVDHPDVHEIIDMSAMNAVSYHAERGAFEVESGARLGDVYRALHEDGR